MKLIDADILSSNIIRTIEEAMQLGEDENREYINIYKSILKEVENQPSINPTQYAHWISHDGYEECSNCKWTSTNPRNYCPHCGYKMYKDNKQDKCEDIISTKHSCWVPDYDYSEYAEDGITKLANPVKFQDGWKCRDCGHYEFSNTDAFCGGCGAKMDAKLKDIKESKNEIR